MEQMEDLCSPVGWGCFYQEEGVEELKHSLLYTTFELESILVSAKEEIARREFELIHLKELLSRTEKERDEAKAKCQKLIQEKELLRQQLQHRRDNQQEAAAKNEDDSRASNCNKFSASYDRRENIASSTYMESYSHPPFSPALPEPALKLAANKPLPEKGKLLQAVMEAGPLLQNLLLAGPLPQWQHPPPQLDSAEIPPVAISSSASSRLLHSDSRIGVNGYAATKKRI